MLRKPISLKFPSWLIKRKSDTHKGDYGHVFIIGGSCGLTGAVCLAAQACLRTGAGLVTVGIPSELNFIFETKLTEVMSFPLSSQRGVLTSRGISRIKEFVSKKADLVIFGPGLSQNKTTENLTRRVLLEVNKPLILDADGINAISKDPEILKKRKPVLIITPHLGEFSRLVKQPVEIIKKQRKKLAKEFAFRYNLILVLKGQRTIVTDGKLLVENTTGNPGMATAGSGDVLTGIIAGLLSQGLNPFLSARLGVYLHGLAGDLAARKKTQLSLIASDIIEYLPEAIKILSC